MISTPLFAGQSIRLTGIQLENDSETVSGWTKDLEIARQLRMGSVPRPMNVDEVKRYYEEAVKKSLKEGQLFHFAIRPLEQDSILGYLRISGIQWAHSSARVELTLGDASVDVDRCAREALQLGLTYAFHEINLFRLSAVLPEYCEQVIHWFEAAGFTLEVCRREVFFHRNRYWNALHYGLLRSEWESFQAEVGA